MPASVAMAGTSPAHARGGGDKSGGGAGKGSSSGGGKTEGGGRPTNRPSTMPGNKSGDGRGNSPPRE